MRINVRVTSLVKIKLYCVRLNKLGLLNKSLKEMASTKIAVTNKCYFTNRYKNLQILKCNSNIYMNSVLKEDRSLSMLELKLEILPPQSDLLDTKAQKFRIKDGIKFLYLKISTCIVCTYKCQMNGRVVRVSLGNQSITH